MSASQQAAEVDRLTAEIKQLESLSAPTDKQRDRLEQLRGVFRYHLGRTSNG